jgi:hypothetical protein
MTENKIYWPRWLWVTGPHGGRDPLGQMEENLIFFFIIVATFLQGGADPLGQVLGQVGLEPSAHLGFSFLALSSAPIPLSSSATT